MNKIHIIYIIIVLVSSYSYHLYKKYKEYKEFKNHKKEKETINLNKLNAHEYLEKKDNKKKVNIQEFKNFIELMKKETKTNCFKIDLEELNEEENIFGSKIGGLPYIEKGEMALLDDENDPMYLLAQINFAELPANSTYPKKGLLQFYIKADDMYGLDMEDRQNKCIDHKVIYIENIDENVTKEEIKTKYVLEKDKYYELPLLPNISLKMHFTLTEEFGNSGDYYFENYLVRRYNEVFNTKIDDFYDLSNDEMDYVCDEMFDISTKMNGYAGFTQDDVRMYDYEDYEVLLLQIASEQDYIMWGDCGVANFFITRKDLENRDFSRVLYNWDCY